ncbi:low molecular weight protein arginine phosphatase [Aquibacillus sp. 3ASR75-11]|uniref:Low molecular weight protein arginine phosphatase n=1 Tax=Terrihalobacillus insolitus TaxID=2950438 RepID=A0A9X4AM84_9BACI|nr:low molecular weight protein arginine phosphatase [Terrihalobacillus insolitus]MDC3411785.1 low molecular weight protein arginine phosphatase [Terrihalobacillus insolitus]MDC3425036.1 low molecular weight protein arginine phosphatase [Terrihalobacillus insolitus]
MRILFVCTGNTCRSPMAEALLKQKNDQIKVQSAGIFAGKGQRASQGTIDVLKEKGIPFHHQSQPITRDLLNWADLVLAMTTQHKQTIVMEYPEFYDKIFTLKEYVIDTENETWEQLKKAYTEMEEKRAIFMKDQGNKLNSNKLDHALSIHLKDEISRIQELEARLPNYDVTDPFGGDLETYKKTLDEIDKFIELLTNKLDNSN